MKGRNAMALKLIHSELVLYCCVCLNRQNIICVLVLEELKICVLPDYFFFFSVPDRIITLEERLVYSTQFAYPDITLCLWALRG